MSLSTTGILQTIDSVGVLLVTPPNGVSTLDEPIVESNISTMPFCEHTFKSDSIFIAVCLNVPYVLPLKKSSSAILFTMTFCSRFAPAESRNSRDKSTINLSSCIICNLLLSVTVATTVASKFSCLQYCINSSTSLGLTIAAIRSCDSAMAISVPVSPLYFFGTAFRLTESPSASSPIATPTPPAPKSLHFLINIDTAGFLNNRCILCSSGALPFCTSAPQSSMESTSCSLDEPVAPPTPSLPVLPPTNITTSFACGFSRLTCDSGTAPITAPASIRFAIKPSW